MGGENGKQPPYYSFYVTGSFSVTNVTCRDRRYVIRTPTLGVRVENVITIVEKSVSGTTMFFVVKHEMPMSR